MSAVVWHGLAADYTDSERTSMRLLAHESRREAWRVHVLKALLDASEIEVALRRRGIEPPAEVFVYTWGNSERRAELKGRRCVVEARGAKRTVRVRFLDNGERVTTSARALRKAA